jgi:hypothetical protein
LTFKAIQQKKVEKKRAEAERVAKLSPEEQRKVRMFICIRLVKE